MHEKSSVNVKVMKKVTCLAKRKVLERKTNFFFKKLVLQKDTINFSYNESVVSSISADAPEVMRNKLS